MILLHSDDRPHAPGNNRRYPTYTAVYARRFTPLTTVRDSA